MEQIVSTSGIVYDLPGGYKTYRESLVLEWPPKPEETPVKKFSGPENTIICGRREMENPKEFYDGLGTRAVEEAKERAIIEAQSISRGHEATYVFPCYESFPPSFGPVDRTRSNKQRFYADKREEGYTPKEDLQMAKDRSGTIDFENEDYTNNRLGALKEEEAKSLAIEVSLRAYTAGVNGGSNSR